MFYPTVYRRRITDITLEDLEQLGVQGLLLDIDNTLTTHDNPNLAPEVTAWLTTMKARGYQLMLVSNNSPERVAPFADKIGLPFQAKAAKPLSKGFRAAANSMHLSVKSCVVIGDQIFTDICGAHFAGMPSVLLEPIQPEVEQKFIVFKRQLERVLLNRPRERRRKEAQYGQ